MADKEYSLFLLCISEREMNTFDNIHFLCVVVYGGFVFWWFFIENLACLTNIGMC